MSTSSSAFTNRVRKTLVSMNRLKKVSLMLMADIIALPICFLIAMLLMQGDYESATRYGIGLYLAAGLITIVVFALSGLYRAVIRFIDQRMLLATGGRAGCRGAVRVFDIGGFGSSIPAAQRTHEFLVYRLFVCRQLTPAGALFPAQQLWTPPPDR